MRSCALVTFSNLPDPVSSGLLREAKRFPCSFVEMKLGKGRIQDHLERLRNCTESDFVGVGLAGTLLLAAAGQQKGLDDRGVLALFPFLGVDAPPYGQVGRSTQAAEALLYLGGTVLGRKALSGISISSESMGLEGVYPAGSVSWAQAAECMLAPDFVSLVVPAAVPITVVLNRRDPAMDELSTEVVMLALNQHLSLGFAAPDAVDLPERVNKWLITGQWPSGPGTLHG